MPIPGLHRAFFSLRRSSLETLSTCDRRTKVNETRCIGLAARSDRQA